MSDTSPLRALHHLGMVGLLQTIYIEVWVPPAVVGELSRVYPDFQRLLGSDYSFLHVKAPGGAGTAQLLQSGKLDPGEAEAIALAIEIGADYLLIDELYGRAEGRRQGLAVIGVIGVLGRAKSLRLIPAVRPLIDALEMGLKFFVGKRFKEMVLKQFGE